MAGTTPKTAFLAGLRDSLPFTLVATPFGVLFGVLAVESGLNLVEIMAMTFTVFAGAAQFTALQLMQEEAPTIVVLASALAVNLRVAMYSASLTPYLGAAPLWQRAFAAYFIVDNSYACSIVRFETHPEMSVPARMAYFFGSVALVAVLWCSATWFGAVVGQAIPQSWALDFALPIAFLAMLGPMLRTPAHVIAALVSIVTALLCAAVPFNLGLIIAGVAGMVAGAQAELVIERRRGAA